METTNYLNVNMPNFITVGVIFLGWIVLALVVKRVAQSRGLVGNTTTAGQAAA